jgi:hypothetical protein
MLEGKLFFRFADLLKEDSQPGGYVQAGPTALAGALGERAAGGVEGVREARAPGRGRADQLHPRALYDWGHGTQAGGGAMIPLWY